MPSPAKFTSEIGVVVLQIVANSGDVIGGGEEMNVCRYRERGTEGQ